MTSRDVGRAVGDEDLVALLLVLAGRSWDRAYADARVLIWFYSATTRGRNVRGTAMTDSDLLVQPCTCGLDELRRVASDGTDRGRMGHPVHCPAHYRPLAARVKELEDALREIKELPSSITITHGSEELPVHCRRCDAKREIARAALRGKRDA